MPNAKPPVLGKHLGVLNLFREADGKLYITVAAADGAMTEYANIQPADKPAIPIEYVERLIIEAVVEMSNRLGVAING